MAPQSACSIMRKRGENSSRMRKKLTPVSSFDSGYSAAGVMIAVFDTMAATGSSSARLMADGVSKATLPTMAGMVASLSGLFFSVWLQNRAKSESERLADHLVTE